MNYLQGEDDASSCRVYISSSRALAGADRSGVCKMLAKNTALALKEHLLLNLTCFYILSSSISPVRRLALGSWNRYNEIVHQTAKEAAESDCTDASLHRFTDLGHQCLYPNARGPTSSFRSYIEVSCKVNASQRGW